MLTVALVPVCTGCRPEASPQPPPNPQQGYPTFEARDRAARMARAVRSGNLHEAAVINGGTYVGEPNIEPDNAPAGIEHLSSLSEAIFLGSPAPFGSRTALSGARINTYFVVRVSETLKGSPQKEISLEVPGGRFEWPDGVVAESRTPGFSVEPGRRYVFFTRKVLASGALEAKPLPAYALVDGARGVADLSEPDGRVRTMSRSPSPPPYASQNVDVFLSRLRLMLSNTK